MPEARGDAGHVQVGGELAGQAEGLLVNREQEYVDQQQQLGS